MEHVHGDTRVLKAASQLVRKDDQSQLGLPIIAHCCIAFLTLQVVEGNVFTMYHGTDIDNACRCARFQGIDQQFGAYCSQSCLLSPRPLK